jgi:hypothetical protein
MRPNWHPMSKKTSSYSTFWWERVKNPVSGLNLALLLLDWVVLKHNLTRDHCHQLLSIKVYCCVFEDFVSLDCTQKKIAHDLPKLNDFIFKLISNIVTM